MAVSKNSKITIVSSAKQTADEQLDWVSALDVAGNAGKVIEVNSTEDGFTLSSLDEKVLNIFLLMGA